ncbi:MAG: M28 family peptidase [Bryobacterales bacterium]|nr:M28 family peptidase [Bryobacterales bacterium]
MPVLPICLLFALPLAAQHAPGNDFLHRGRMKADMQFLAGDGMRGRLTGSAEYNLAADWIESRFARIGLEPASGSSFFHRFDLVLSRLAPGNALEIGSGDSRRQGRLREDFYPLIFSPTARAAAPVKFLGYGIEAPHLDWNDYAAPQSVHGAIVLIFDGEPGANDPKSRFDGVVSSESSNPIRKVLWAQSHGADGVLVVNPSHQENSRDSFPSAARSIWPDQPPHLERFTLATYANRIRIPVAQISPALAEMLLGKPLAALRTEAEAGPWKTPLRAAHSATMHIALERKIVEDRNVVGLIRGTDPALKDEAVIVSGHYDHNGATAEQIFNGADDNASGAIATIEIAEAYMQAAAKGQKPKRTVIFASWGSEERCCGPLLGAWAWVEDQVWPLAKTVAVLNMDMIGRSEEVPPGGGSRFNGLAPQTAAQNANNVNLIGTSYSPDLSKAAGEANLFDLGLLRRYDNSRSNHLRRSDQWPFLNRGVPALWFHTGLHPDYHTPYDRPERIDYAKMERIARLVHQLSWNLANAPSRPKMAQPRVIPQE